MTVTVPVLAGLLAVGGGGCSRDEPATTTRPSSTTSVEADVISDEEAVRIARAEIEDAFDDFDFEVRTSQVVPVGDTLDVSFPTTDATVLEEELHVILDARTGEVRERQVRG